MEVPKSCCSKCSRWTIRATLIAITTFVSFLLLMQFWIIQSTFQSIVKEKYASLQNTDFTNLKFLQHWKDSVQLENDHLRDQLASLSKTIIVGHNDAGGIAPAFSEDNLHKQNDQITDLKWEMKVMGDYLRQSVEFLPLKDINVDPMTEPDRTWFMSTLRGKEGNDTPEHFYFPSETSNGKILCIKGRDVSNSYGFAWPKYLPWNSTLLPGLTFIADNYWDYNNPWHSMMSLVAHEAWRMENKCRAADRFVLYHKGELVKKMGSWISNLMQASLEHQVKPDELEYGSTDGAVCFQEAVVYRRSLGRMSLEKRLAMFDMIRCKARKFCNISEIHRFINGNRIINITLFARTGARSFQNESLVASVITEECNRVAGCNFRLLHIDNLSFCQQVEVMSTTDILVTVHGAQLTNMMFMSKGSSVMEMFPKGWLERAGVGQYIYHWLASWTGMIHEGTYRDTEGPSCPTPSDPDQCFSFYKDMKVGYNQTYLAHWTSNVLAVFQK